MVTREMFSPCHDSCIMPCCLFTLLLQDLEEMFGRYGRIIDIRLNRDRFTGRCKGFAFVCMEKEEDVDRVGLIRKCHGCSKKCPPIKALLVVAFPGGETCFNEEKSLMNGDVAGTAAGSSCVQCIRKLDKTSVGGYRLTVERAKTDRRG